MDLLLKILMILGSAILIFNAAARPDNTLWDAVDYGDRVYIAVQKK